MHESELQASVGSSTKREQELEHALSLSLEILELAPLDAGAWGNWWPMMRDAQLRLSVEAAIQVLRKVVPPEDP